MLKSVIPQLLPLMLQIWFVDVRETLKKMHQDMMNYNIRFGNILYMRRIGEEGLSDILVVYFNMTTVLS